MKKLALVLAVSAASMAYAGDVDSTDGVYVCGHLHATMLGDMQDEKMKLFTGTTEQGGTTDLNLEYSVGFNAGLSVGYRMGDLGFEGEFSRFSSSIDKATVKPNTTFRTGAKDTNTKDIGDLTGYLFMANAHYGFHGLTDAVVPHVGVGVGLASFTLNADNKTFNAKGDDSSHSKFAYQFILGADMPLDAVTVGVDYRYVGIGSNDYRIDQSATQHYVFKESAGQHMIGAHVKYAI